MRVERQRQRRPDQAAAKDDDICVHEDSLGRQSDGANARIHPFALTPLRAARMAFHIYPGDLVEMASRAGGSDTGLWRETVKAGAVRGGALVASIAVFVATLLMALSLASYHAADAALNTAAGGDVQNLVGTPGAWFADLALSLFGPAVALLIPIGPIVGLRLWRDQPAGRWVRMLRNAAIGVALIATALATISDAAVLALPAGWGGAIGLSLAGIASWALAFAGDPTISTWGLRAIGLIAGVAGVVVWARSLELALGDRRWRRRVAAPGAAYDETLRPDEDEPLTLTRKAAGAPRAVATPDPRPAPVIADRTLAPSIAKTKPKQTQLDLGHTYKLPTLDLLSPPPPPVKGAIDKAALERNARLLENVLDDFKVRGRITEVRPGPVVTMYELEPESGVKASRVIALADDIARNMSAISARVATIPGRTVIGIELPNAKREAVALHELVASQTFEDQSAQLPIILGKNIAGDPVIADLAPMPHLLVAGTTGSGKSVGLNCMILSLLYRLTPDQCRMIMIDPKMLELSMYDDIPHLLSPVVTDPAKAVRALKWAVEQMEDRYRQMSSVGVRSLAGFNDKVRAAKAKGQRL